MKLVFILENKEEKTFAELAWVEQDLVFAHFRACSNGLETIKVYGPSEPSPLVKVKESWAPVCGLTATNAVLELDGVYRIREVLTPLDLPWNVLHPDIQAAARDKDGRIWGYSIKDLRRGHEEWEPEDECLYFEIYKIIETSRFNAAVPWETSLTLRPKDQKKPKSIK